MVEGIIVVALENEVFKDQQEAIEFQNKIAQENLAIQWVFTGVGKVNAAAKLTQAIVANKNALQWVLNIGSAGSQTLSQETLVQGLQFLQHDMHVEGLGFLPGQTPFENTILLNTSYFPFNNVQESGIIATGDSFIERTFPKEKYHQEPIAFDMESYALCKSAQFLQVPFYCIKFISDGANEKASLSWEAALCQGRCLFQKYLLNWVQDLAIHHHKS